MRLTCNLLTRSLLQLIAEGSSKLASVPSGGAAPAAGGAAAGGAAAEAPKEEEKKEEGSYLLPIIRSIPIVLISMQRRRSPTRTWASVSSTKRPITSTTSSSTWTFPGRLDDLRSQLRIRFHQAWLGFGLGMRGLASIRLL